MSNNDSPNTEWIREYKELLKEKFKKIDNMYDELHALRIEFVELKTKTTMISVIVASALSFIIPILLKHI